MFYLYLLINACRAIASTFATGDATVAAGASNMPDFMDVDE